MSNPRARKVDSSDPNVRVSGEPDSPQNQLRYELYSHAFERLSLALEKENYFEAVFLSDSIITDRLQALLQTITHGEEEQYGFGSVGTLIGSLWGEIKDRGIKSEELTTLRPVFLEVERWVPKRNVVAHGFVSVTPKNIQVGKEERLNALKEAAIEGATLARVVTSETGKAIRALKQES